MLTETDGLGIHGRHHRRKNLKYHEVKDAIKGTKSVYEACEKLKVGNGTLYKAMKRFKLRKPMAWVIAHRFRLGRLRRLNLASIIESETDRMWVGLMVGTECGMWASYQKSFDITELKVGLGMTDRAYVERFAELCKVSPPRCIPAKVAGHSSVWSRNLRGLRALMILKEVLPYLLGDKARQARRAIEFFSPTGYKKRRFTSDQVWPSIEFPLRRKGPRRRLRLSDGDWTRFDL